MRNFQYHLFNPYAVNEGVFDILSGLFNGKPKKTTAKPSTIAEKRKRAFELDNPDKGYISPFGPDGPISKEIIDDQQKRKAKELETLKRVAGPNATIEPQSKNPIPPRTAESQPSNIQPPKVNNPTNKITSIPISFTPQTFRLPAAVSKPPPSFNSTSDKLKDIIDKLKQQQKGVKIGEMNQYTPYLFHSPLLEYNDEYFNENVFGSIVGAIKGAVNRMDRTKERIKQGAGKNTLYTPELNTMQKTGIDDPNVVRKVLNTQARARIDTRLGQKYRRIADIMNIAGVPYSRAAAVYNTERSIEERNAKQNPSNNSGNRFYSNHPIRRESTDISQYSPYLFHSPLLEDFYFTENCIDDPIEYSPYAVF